MNFTEALKEILDTDDIFACNEKDSGRNMDEQNEEEDATRKAAEKGSESVSQETKLNEAVSRTEANSRKVKAEVN